MNDDIFTIKMGELRAGLIISTVRRVCDHFKKHIHVQCFDSDVRQLSKHKPLDEMELSDLRGPKSYHYHADIVTLTIGTKTKTLKGRHTELYPKPHMLIKIERTEVEEIIKGHLCKVFNLTREQIGGIDYYTETGILTDYDFDFMEFETKPKGSNQ